MSSSRLASLSVRPVLIPESCAFCQSRSLIQTPRRNGTAKPSTSRKWRAEAPSINISRRSYATQRLDVKRIRADVDVRNRMGFYTLSNKQGVLKMDANKAASIIADFLHQKSNMDHGSNIRRLVKKYHVDLEDLTSLAIVTFKIPDLSDPEKKAMLPPSQHKIISGQLLQGCAQAEDPLAIVHVLTAVYSNSSSADPASREIALLFPQTEISKYRGILEKLGSKAKSIALGPDVLTLQGSFLERDGQREKAIDFYKEAVLRSHLKFEPGSRHPMQFPLVDPWNALGFLLKRSRDPSDQAQAKVYFEKGALEGDDPLSYYELAAFEPKGSTKWLQYTSKAAASGHRQAMVNLADFYQEVSSEHSPVLADKRMQQALNWLLGWKPGSAASFAREWLQASANCGHKPSMLKLADYYETRGEHERAKEQLRQVLEPPVSANQVEEWPQLVHLAKKRLAGV
ncbi:Nn.00g041290.m01.CDS01 [Neocucurbitaria sp. VM-36]